MDVLQSYGTAEPVIRLAAESRFLEAVFL